MLGEIVVSLGQRILGRTAAEDVVDPSTGDVIVKRNEEIMEEHTEEIEQANIHELRIRSVLTCESAPWRVRQVLWP